jgi:hypothetical protein
MKGEGGEQVGNDMDKVVKKLEAKVKECMSKSVETPVKYSKTSSRIH